MSNEAQITPPGPSTVIGHSDTSSRPELALGACVTWAISDIGGRLCSKAERGEGGGLSR